MKIRLFLASAFVAVSVLGTVVGAEAQSRNPVPSSPQAYNNTIAGRLTGHRQAIVITRRGGRPYVPVCQAGPRNAPRYGRPGA